MVCIAWEPPNVMFFAWLTIHNMIWMVNPFERGWDNCGLCPLCKQSQETRTRLFSYCRYSKRLWGMVKSWLVYPLSKLMNVLQTSQSKISGP
jgi:hypothetical protein